MKKYLNKSFDFKKDDGDVINAKVIDIEFETGFGPIFLMRTKRGDSFWATLKELKKYATSS